MSVPGAIVSALLFSAPIACAPQAPGDNSTAPAPQTFLLIDTRSLVEHGVKAEAVEYRGRKAVRLTAEGEDGFAFIKDLQFRDGTIEVDMSTKTTTPPGVRMPGFAGVGFRATPDASRYELFYLRPGNASADDQAIRNHSLH